MSQKHATSIQKNYGLYEYLMPLNLYETIYIASTNLGTGHVTLQN
jgi:hypothetical protein